MSCHHHGMIEKADQVREHVLKNPGAFARADLDTIKALYPPRSDFAALPDARPYPQGIEP
jgi:hypothetical protein